MWLNANWTYRKKITITGQATAGTSYQIPIKIGDDEISGTPYDLELEGNSANFPASKNDGGDLRFTADDGTTLLDFWVEKVVDSVAYIWVEVKADLGTNKDIYVYYGFAGASNGSNGTDTFLLFDDFNDDDLDDGSGGLWTWIREPSFDEGVTEADKLNIPTTPTDLWGGTQTAPILRSSAQVTGDIQTTIKLKFSPTGNYHTAGVIYYSDDDNWTRTQKQWNGGAFVKFEKEIANSPTSIDADANADAELFLVLKRIGTTVESLYGTDSWNLTSLNSDTINLTNKYLGLFSLHVGESEIPALFNYIYTRKRIATEPAFASASAEEEGGVEITETITLVDTVTASPSLRKVNIAETITLCEKIQGINSASYASRIVYKSGYAYIVTNTDPAEIVKVDLTCTAPCDDVVYETYKLLVAGTYYKYAKDLVIDDTNGYIYVACAEGNLIKILTSNLATQTKVAIETGATADDCITVGALEDLDIIFIGTDATVAELYQLDNRTTSKLTTNFVFLNWAKKKIATIFSFIFGGKITTNFPFFVSQDNKIRTNFAFNTEAFDALTYYGREDFVVKIDGTSVTDVDLSSITIVHKEDERSVATFVLGRNFDKPDYYYPSGSASEITNKNTIIIYLGTALLFSGRITALNPVAEGEKIGVEAESNAQWDILRTTVELPIATLNEEQHIYHAVVQDINIDNPPADLGVVTITNLSAKAGERILTTNTGLFDEDMIGETIDITSGTNFTPGSYEITGYRDTNNITINKIPTTAGFGDYSYAQYLLNASGGTGYVAVNPKYYRGIKVNLGIQQEERISSWSYGGEKSDLADQIKESTFIPMQNVTYFWFADILNLGAPSSISPMFGTTVDFVGFEEITDAYIGTSMASSNAGLFEITGAGYLFQRTYDNIETDLGWYYRGTFPYKEVSASNGKYISKWHYEDREDGLYRVKGERYDNTQYARKIARLEYDQLKNINGDIVPITSASVDLSLDGFLWYGVKLLTRFNIGATTQADVYKDDNGFPVSAKEIVIDSGDMRVHLTLDNILSKYELKKIFDRYPNEPKPRKEQIFQVAQKWDLANWESFYNSTFNDNWKFGWDRG